MIFDLIVVEDKSESVATTEKIPKKRIIRQNLRKLYEVFGLVWHNCFIPFKKIPQSFKNFWNRNIHLAKAEPKASNLNQDAAYPANSGQKKKNNNVNLFSQFVFFETVNLMSKQFIPNIYFKKFMDFLSNSRVDNPPDLNFKAPTSLNILKRQKETEFFHTLLGNLEASKPDKYIVGFNGVSGIGKTTLLSAEVKSIVEADYPTWFYLYLDLDVSHQSSTITDFKSCVEALKKALIQEATIKNASGFVAKLEQLPSNEAPERVSFELARLLQEHLEEAQIKAVLVLDGLVQTKPWFIDFEANFLSPLIPKKTPDAKKWLLVLIGSRSEIRLDRFELRLQLHNYKLGPLLSLDNATSPGDAVEQSPASELVGQLHDELKQRYSDLRVDYPDDVLTNIGKQLLKISAGHPGALSYLWNGKINFQDTQQLKSSLKDFILDHYVVLPENKTQERSENLDILRLAIQELAIYRRFDVWMLQEATANSSIEAVSAEFKNYKSKPLYYNGLSQQMAATRIVEWSNAMRGYIYDECYRYILVNALATNKEDFSKRHKKAVQQYLSLLFSKRGENTTRAIYWLELEYHVKEAFEGRFQAKILECLELYSSKGKLPEDNIFIQKDLFDSDLTQPSEVELPLEQISKLKNSRRLKDSQRTLTNSI